MVQGKNRQLKIGISSDIVEHGHIQLRHEYIDAVYCCGAIPVIIPCVEDCSMIDTIVKDLDGIILSGGCDIDPSFFGETASPYIGAVNKFRDRREFEILMLAIEYKIPVFGICRGLQIINVAFGGSLYQDIATDLSPTLASHQQDEPTSVLTHTISMVEGTRSAMLMPREFAVNSHHHQAVKRIGNGLIVAALSPDNIVEVIESSVHNIIAVQFHPERMPNEGYSIIDNWINNIDNLYRDYSCELMM